MQFEPKLAGEAAALGQAHRAMLERLPATFHASILIELEKWSALFDAEHAYQRTMLGHLATLGNADRQRVFAGLIAVEAEAGLAGVREPRPTAWQDAAQAALRAKRLITRWRHEVETVFEALQPAIDRQLFPPDAPRRLVVQIYAANIAVKVEQLWGRFTGQGVRVPLALEGVRGPDAFLRGVFGGGPSTLFAALRGAAGASPLDAWIVESGASLHAYSEAFTKPDTERTHTGLSYERLRGYRDQLTRALYQKIQTGVESPQAFAAYARSLRIAPPPDPLLDDGEPLTTFIRDIFLTGNGTLFVNNTFVEWAAAQALRRVQPRLLVTRYGVRDKMKPFSSLLLVSQPRASDQIPLIEDPVGSFVDVEQLSYYVWLHAQKQAAYRQRTLYVFLAEGIDEMLVLGTDPTAMPTTPAQPVPLPDVGATLAKWLDVTAPDPAGRAIDTLLA
jgi:hypothetical protein